MSEISDKMKSKVLIIDDESDIRFLIKSILAKEGYDIFEAQNGPEGIKLFNEMPIDLVITDVKMPGMNGIEVLRELKNINSEVEVVILTGHGNLEMAISAIKESAYDFVTKPLDNIQSLITTVKTGLEKRRLTLENKQLLIELKNANDELSLKNSNYFEVLGFVSHELKNAMTILSGYVGLFQDGIVGDLTSNQKEIMDKIAYNVESINNLIINYLNLSKIEKNALSINKQEIDIYNDVLKSVIDVIMMQAKRGNLKIDLYLGGIPSGVLFTADPDLMRIVFLNLLINAIKYTKEGGKIAYGYEDRGNIIRFNVYSEGAGIPEEYRSKIFEKFVRIKSDVGKRKEGSGLGLFTVKKIIEAHNGSIWVESDTDNWTNFIFDLPKKDEAK
ncbi:response regulator [Thermodesulfobacteriota bacterium]